MEILTKEQLADRLQVSNTQIETLTREGKIPHFRIGHRTLRFNWEKVLAALEREEPPNSASHDQEWPA